MLHTAPIMTAYKRQGLTDDLDHEQGSISRDDIQLRPHTSKVGRNDDQSSPEAYCS